MKNLDTSLFAAQLQLDSAHSVASPIALGRIALRQLSVAVSVAPGVELIRKATWEDITRIANLARANKNR